jgi:hypothetical protein
LWGSTNTLEFYQHLRKITVPSLRHKAGDLCFTEGIDVYIIRGLIPMKPILILILLSLMVGGLALAQEDVCPELVESTLQMVDEVCEPTGRNQACYGHVAMTAAARPGVPDFKFEAAGDITNVINVQTLALEPMNVDTGQWGVAVMKLQANLPDTMPGQNVTFVLFGDVEITSAVDNTGLAQGSQPLQAFYLTTGIGDTACEEAPESGLMVQTPEGVGEVAFTVNEVNVTLGSTVYFQANPEQEEMIVSTIEGKAILERAGQIQEIVAGTRLRLPIEQIGERIGALDLPDLLEPYDEIRLNYLPIDLLEREIDIALPLTIEAIQNLREQWNAGEGIEGLCEDVERPVCGDLPDVLPELPADLPSLPLPKFGG